MDIRAPQADRPIYVDLDGTVAKTDLLWESLFTLARQKPHLLPLVPFWLASGKARLKAELANRIDFDPSLLPYRDELVAELAKSQARGRRVVLATGANRKLAEAVAEHLGVFDAVMASDEQVNLTAHRKLERIVVAADVDGFDYIGNSHEDICLFDAAAEATVVAPDRPAAGWQRRTGAHVLPGADLSERLRGLVKAMRPHQWTKNVLIFVPVALEHRYLEFGSMLAAFAAFMAFSLAASSVYIVNDLLDLASDRRHKTKRNRPFASGAVPIPTGLILAAGLVGTSVLIASMLTWQFQLVLAGYLTLTTLYSVALKRMLLLDVLALAGLYTVRILAGSAATEISLSFWLMAFSIFFFLSLALVKRYTELLDFGTGAERSKTGRGYVDCDLEMIGQAGIASGFAATLVLALYIDSPTVQSINSVPWILWPLCPLVLYIIVRIWILARRNQMHDDPVVFILRDWRSQIMIGLGAALFVAAAYI
ncbi:UbiA family prenyltransferase [Aureimonas leprariae]|uniref:UbiA family prenyltransferase n=1 Tax=Plantimonas leprariae TaxID=2615207 RepID=A0A7V7TXM9_9HYPH|nr:UbiA family prenyltransferase [Aureimonas leprariae]KAB0681909.1 UbiA family prenyltransferase [Aureimonas leprariae]